MKKSKISILVCIALFLAVCARAEEIKIDFDGRSFKTMNIMTVLNLENKDIGDIEMPTPESVTELPVSREELNKNLDYSIKSAIEYCQRKHFRILENNFRTLLLHGSIEEKYEFVYHEGNYYNFPSRISKIISINKKSFGTDFENLSKIRPQICIRSHTEKKCINRQVCRVVCAMVGAGAGYAFGGSVGAAVGIGGATQVCKEVCELVPECSEITVCDEWQDAPLNAGQDSNGNWY